MGTRTQIQLLLSDENARKMAKEGTVTKTNVVGNVAGVFEDSFENPKATLEHNYWILDGQYQVPESENSFKIKSTVISYRYLDLRQYPKIKIEFSQPITTRKITITYGTYYDYYNSSNQIDNTCNGSRISAMSISWEYGTSSWSRSLTDFDYTRNYSEFDLGDEYTFTSMQFTLDQTVRPYRSAKITGIYFGELRTFTDELTSANLLQETSYLTDTLPIGTLEFEVNSPNDEFNVLNPDGIFDKLHINAPVRLITQKDENTYDYNTYFLKRWENSNNRITKFYCEDAIGLLQTTEGEYYTNYDLNQFSTRYLHLDDIAGRIVEKCPSVNIELNMPGGIDTDLYYRYVIDNTNYRDVLQKLYFGFANYFIACFGNNIKATTLPSTIEDTEDVFSIEDVIIDTDNASRINAVKTIFVNNQILEPESNVYSRIYESTLNAGTYEYFFEKPYRFSFSSTYTYASNNNTAKHLILNVANNNSSVYIEGYKFNTNALVITKVNNLPDVEDGSSITVDNYNVKYSTFDFNQTGIDYIETEFINNLANYYNGTRYQYIFSTRNLRNPETALGRYIEVESTQGRKIVGNIIKIETDLFNGLIYTITIDGILED